MSKAFSGQKVVKILCREFGFCFISRKGSHVKLRRKKGNRNITTIIPIHKELAIGTLRGILKLAEIDEKEFQKRT